MSIEIHDECRRQLEGLIASALTHAKVRHHTVVVFQEVEGLLAADAALPRAIRETAAEWLTDTPITTFVTDRVRERVKEHRAFELDADPYPLTTCPGFEDPSQAACQLLDEFRALPRTYNLMLELPLPGPDILKDRTWEASIGKRAALVLPGKPFASKFPTSEERPPSLAEYFFTRMLPPVKWPHRFHLTVTADGFISGESPTVALQRGLIQLRSILGSLLAIGVLMPRGAQLFPLETPVYVYEHRDPPPHVPRQNALLAAEESAFLSTIAWAGKFGDGKLPDQEIPRVLSHVIADAVDRVFGDDRQAARRVAQAAQWFFDCHCGRSELLQFVQATVALEILVGDSASEHVGIAKLLANRCAYALARTHDERDEIADDLHSIYTTRSRIVHQGKNRLRDAERRQLSSLRRYCARLIRHEIKLLKG